MRKSLLMLLFLWGGADVSAQTIVQQFTGVSQGVHVSLPEPTLKGSMLIAMPGELSPGEKVSSVTDNAPDGGNTYKQVPGAASSCPKGILDIWYCENCKPGVTELEFHLSGNFGVSINSFLEVSNMASSSVLDGSGAQVSNGTATSAGLEVGPSIQTTATDFIIARYASTVPFPNGVTPAAWKHKPTYVYVQDGPPGTYQPTLTGGKAAGGYCVSMAAFKTAASAAAVSPPKKD